MPRDRPTITNLLKKTSRSSTSPVALTPRRPVKRRRFLILLSLFIALCIVARLALPSIVVWYVNRTLARLPGYKGSIEGVDLALLRGAYTIQGTRIFKSNGAVSYPLFEAQLIDLSVQWGALLEGKIVGEIVLAHGTVTFVNGRNSSEDQLGIDSEWLEVVKDLFPLRINRFALSNFDVHYRDPHASPPVDVTINRVRVEGRNFSNTRRPVDALNSPIDVVGLVERTASLTAHAVVAPSHRKATFKLDGSLKKLPLTRLNDLFRAYGSFDVEKGSADMYLWIDAQNGSLRGTLKPLIHEIEVFSLDQDDESILDTLWQSLVGATAGILENRREEQVGTIVPFEVNGESLETGLWTTVVETVKNAFFKALSPGLSQAEKAKE